MNDEIMISLDPFLARTIEVVALERGLTFIDALFFLLEAVLSPRRVEAAAEAI